MGGIYIKGMEMPKGCENCRFFAWSLGVGQHCAVASDITFHATIDGMDVAYERNGKCPLILIPPHGRLIDADAFGKKIIEIIERQKYDDLYAESFSVGGILREVVHELRGEGIDGYANAPTIIPAEEGE